MLGCQLGSQGLVDRDGGQLGELVLTRDDGHDRTAVALGGEDGQDVGALGQDHDGRHAVTVQVSQCLSHGLRVASLGSGQDEGVPPLAHRPGDRGEDGGHPVRQPGRQQDAHGPGGARGQRAGGEVRLIAQCLNGRQNLLTCLGTDRRVVVEYAGDGLR